LMNARERLCAAKTAPEILTALAAAIRSEAPPPTPDAAIRSEAPPPTPDELADWLPQCPDHARQEHGRRLISCLPPLPDGLNQKLDDRKRLLMLVGMHCTITIGRRGEAGTEGRFMDPDPKWTARVQALQLNSFRMALWATSTSDERLNIEPSELADWCQWVHLAWRSKQKAEQVRHPLAPIVRDWQDRPVEVEPDRRRDKRILSVMRATETESRPERQRGMLFGGLIDARTAEVDGPQLPLLEPTKPEIKHVAILDLADASGVPVMARGRGAPLAARAYVRLPLSVRPEDRRRESVRLAIKVAELRKGLYPNGWRSGKHWPEIRDVLRDIHNFTIRLPDGGLWFMLALRRLPDGSDGKVPRDDELVIIDVAYPPGSSTGPVIDLPEMDRLSVGSASRWRAYIAGHSLAWEPGKTRRPVPQAPGRYGWSRDPNDYPVVSLADMRRLAFGAKDRKHRPNSEIVSAWRDLPGLVAVESVIDPRTLEKGWRIMPADAVHNPDGE